MKRDAYFDNMRLLLIFLVVFGHMIQPFTSESKLFYTLYSWIYSFHMPAFILIAGFFARGRASLSFIINLTKQLLIPYTLFQILYSVFYFLLGRSDWYPEHLFYPHWSLWFLLSLFCWHLLLIIYKRLSFSLGLSISIIFGLLIGYIDQVEHAFSLSRTISFFPFFLVGYHLEKADLTRFKKQGYRLISLCFILLVALLIYSLPAFDTDWLLGSKSYSSLQAGVAASLIRLGLYLLAFAMTFSIAAWIPDRPLRLSYIGERTLYVYLLHGFFIQCFRQYQWPAINNHWGLIPLALISGLLVYGLSRPAVLMLFQPVIELSGQRMKQGRDAFKQARKKLD